MLRGIIVGLVILLVVGSGQAQSPFGINYQGVAREADGTPISAQAIGLRISITNGPNGQVAYSEEHAVTTNDFGLFTVVIGKGQSSDNLQDVDWSTGNKWLEIELDAKGDGSFQLIGSQQMLSVPYALFSLESADQLNAGSGIAIVGDQIINTSPDQPVTIQGTGNITTSGTYPNFNVDGTGLATTTYVDQQNALDGDKDPTNELENLSQVLSRGNDANGGTISNLSEPSLNADAATKNYVDQQDALDLDRDPANELQSLADVLSRGNDANNSVITNLADPVQPTDAVNRQYLEQVNANDYAFKTNLSATGDGNPLIFDLTNFDFDEGTLISGNTLSITESGVYYFTVKGTSTSSSSIILTVTGTSGATDYLISIVNVGRYSDTILVKLSAGDNIVVRANSTFIGENFSLEFFGFKI